MAVLAIGKLKAYLWLKLNNSLKEAKMAEVTIYSTTVCPYCIRAKHLLERKGVEYKEIKNLLQR